MFQQFTGVLTVMDKYNKFDEIEVPCELPFPKELVDGIRIMNVKENTKFININSFVERLFQVSFFQGSK